MMNCVLPQDCLRQRRKKHDTFLLPFPHDQTMLKMERQTDIALASATQFQKQTFRLVGLQKLESNVLMCEYDV